MNRRRSWTALSLALATVAGTLTFVAPTAPALAHGGMTYPATRTYACYVDGLAGGNGGDLNPTNPACAEAVRIGGKTPLWNWFGNLLSDSAGRHEEVIPDGNLCGPGATFAAYRMPHPDWPTTTLESGAPITFRYNAWAAHPGTWTQYVTPQGWDPSQPLRWDDLEVFDEVTNPPINGSGPHGAEYTWNAVLPERTGRHVIYSVWERSDSPEAFYNCSDVVFTGGNEEPDTQAPTAPGTPSVTGATGSTIGLSWAASTDDRRVAGYDVYRAAAGGDQLVATATTNSATVTGLEPDSDYTFYVVARDAAGNRSPASPSVAASTNAQPTTGPCRVQYSVGSTWNGGFTGTVRITNTGTTAVNGWELSFSFGGGQTVSQGWSATWSQSGQVVTARSASWNGTIQPGGSVEAGFNATTASGNPAPSTFTLNGATCATA
ncbi:lytic polysaccharide monooxygenase [Allonocardiopsis opalescens]|uniref:Chitin-binding protein n=1 Tax=Allonocardiopsis opalescens TaxID=1144618 RepID=A0A2T0Q4Z1_9ACTN|nr:lytic polysaccharide monooxygenase [Allonocardiopsis opalescens]PRX98885.1 chitin-binding protein [Allonocardiopsis opalescens]